MKFDKSIKLVVEGPTDINFLKDFIEQRFSIQELPREVFIEAKNNNLRSIRGQIETANKRGEIVLAVFDADRNSEMTKARLVEESNELNVILDHLFTMPDNSSEGNLESLLLEIVNPKMTTVFDCIDKYEECVEELVKEDYKSIDNKGKIFIYIDSFNYGGSGKPGKTDFKEIRLWNLNSDFLQPLYDFLAPHFE